MFVIKESLSKTKLKRKQKVITTAFNMFTTKGIAQTSMNDIADECILTRRTIYNYFENKADLVSYLAIECINKIIEEFSIDYDLEENGFNNTIKVFSNIFEYFQQQSQEVKFITQAEVYLTFSGHNEKFTSRLDEALESITSNILTPVLLGVEDESIGLEKDSALDYAKILFHSLFSYFQKLSLKGSVDELTKNDTYLQFVKVLINSVAK